MKKILFASFIVGAAAAGAILYLAKNGQFSDGLDEAADAADNARNTLNKHARKTSRIVKRALNGELN